VVLRENCVVLFLTLLHVDEGVARACHKNGRRALIKWIVRNLEVAKLTLDDALATNAHLSYELLTLPVPEEDLIVGFACERYNHALLTRAEGASDELLGVVCIAVLDLLWKSLLALSACHVEDGKLSFVASGAPLAHSQILLALRKSHMSNGLRVLRA